MSMFVCALSLAVALLLDPTTAGPPTSERQLYQSAAAAIEQRDLRNCSNKWYTSTAIGSWPKWPPITWRSASGCSKNLSRH